EGSDFPGEEEGRASLAVSPDGLRVAYENAGHRLRVSDWAGETTQDLGECRGPARDAEFSLDGRRLTAFLDDGTLRTWDLDRGEQLHRWPAPHPTEGRAVYSPDRRRVALCSRETCLRVWDVGAGRDGPGLVGHVRTIQVVRFSPDGRLLLSRDDDSLFVW